MLDILIVILVIVFLSIVLVDKVGEIEPQTTPEDILSENWVSFYSDSF